MIALKYVAAVFIGYALGAIPFGLIAGKLFRGVDVREYGSGKTGATNVLRTAGAKAGLFTVVTDLGKAYLAVLIAWLILHSYAAQAATAVAAMAGHSWPVYARFRGGRAVGAFIGGMGVMYWPIALVCGPVLGLAVALLTRYVSLGSIAVATGSFLAILVMFLLDRQPIEYLAYAVAGGGLILLLHRDNIQRLCSHTERRLGEKGARRDTSWHEVE